MSIRSSLANVRIAEADLALHRAGISAAWRGLKQETERAATPGRVIGAGLIAGFVSGLRSPSASTSVPLGDKLFGALIDTAFAGFGAAMAAGAAAAEAQDESIATNSRAQSASTSSVGSD
jgi:F0F1-type ATP synthase membrane subunit c/vacuolar-type H+-ATPase subunit K